MKQQKALDQWIMWVLDSDDGLRLFGLDPCSFMSRKAIPLDRLWSESNDLCFASINET